MQAGALLGLLPRRQQWVSQGRQASSKGNADGKEPLDPAVRREPLFHLPSASLEVPRLNWPVLTYRVSVPQ